MAELVSFEDAARELGATTEQVSALVSSGKLQTGEEGGLLMITRESLDAYRDERATAPLRLAELESEPEVAPTVALAGEEEPGAEVEEKPAETPAAEPTGEETESIFGDEGFELETFEEAAIAEAPGEELAELEEAGEELGAEEAAELTMREGAAVRLRAVALGPPVSTGVSVMVVLTFILLLLAGLVVFNFALEQPQVIFEPIGNWLVNLVK